jgi:hypothetical protein
MITTTIAYKNNNRIYVGEVKQDLKELDSFKSFKGMDLSEFEDEMFYVIMVESTGDDSKIKIYQIDQMPLNEIFENVNLAQIDKGDMLMIGNKILSRYYKLLVYH